MSWIGLVLLILVIIGSAGGGKGADTAATASPSASPSPSVSAATSHPRAPTSRPPGTTASAPATTASPPVRTTRRSPPPTGALAGLAALPVKGRAAMTGYSRAQFGPAWTDDVTVADGHNGCDTRNDILRRDLSNVVIKSGTHGCVVTSGVLRDPYTSTVIAFTRGVRTSGAIQIDHVVALGNAWQTGAQRLSLAVRTNMANDPLELLAVSGPANDQKGDADAASWLPPNKAFRCSYVAIQVAVKIRYHLWVTPAEHAAIARALSACPGQRLPNGGPPAASSPYPGVTPAPAPSLPAPTTRAPTTRAPTTRAPAPPPAVPTVHPGAFCTPPGAHGVTSKGTRMTCALDRTGKRYRWRKA